VTVGAIQPQATPQLGILGLQPRIFRLQASKFGFQARILGSQAHHFGLKAGELGFQRRQPLQQGIYFRLSLGHGL
jgi:hypothetical protein